jgi:superfamily I DNA/RNA helicase
VEYVPVASVGQIESEVSRTLHRLIRDELVPPAHIAVLVGSTRSTPLRHEDRIGAFQTTSDQHAEPGKVLRTTVRKFKGLERPVVILTGIDDLQTEDEQALLYVGLSRARVHLVVIATSATLDRLHLLRAG